MKASTAAPKVLKLIEQAGAKGLTHTQLLQATRLKTADLAYVLKELEDAFKVVSRQLRRSEWAAGRQPRTYWHVDHAPKELTTKAPTDTPTLSSLDAQPPKGGTCKQCGGAIPSRGPGRLPDFCTPACRALYLEGGTTLGRFLDRAREPRAYAQACILLVTADLTLRGYTVAFSVGYVNNPLVVHNGAEAFLLHVVPISDEGYFPPADTYDCMAAVYRDGRIAYGGKNPLPLNDGIGIDSNAETSKGSEPAVTPPEESTNEEPG